VQLINLDHLSKGRMIRHVSKAMNSRGLFSPKLAALAIAFIFTASCSPAFAQVPSGDRPTRRDFGSSVRKLKWDPERKTAVETKPERMANTSAEEDVVRVETSLVVCNVSVVDKQGRSVPGLTQADFAVMEDNTLQQVGSFSLGDNSTIPRSIVLLIDYSGSQLPFINTSIAAAKTLVDKLGPMDRMALVTDDVEMLLDFTTDKKKLKEKLEYLRKKCTAKPSLFGSFRMTQFGRSEQYSALMATLKEAFDDEDQRPIVIFQTDGDELMLLRDSIIGPYIPPNLSPAELIMAEADAKRMEQYQREHVREFSLNDIYKQAERSRAIIYTVIPGFRLVGLPLDEQIRKMKAESEQRVSAWSDMLGRGRTEQKRRQEDEQWNRTSPDVLRNQVETEAKVQSALAEVAPLTGGWTSFLEQPSQADEIYSRIFADINQRYVIGYYPTNKQHDGRRRKVTVEIRGHPEYVVMGRKSYLAPEPE
jgi:VWFA-related protein